MAGVRHPILRFHANGDIRTAAGAIASEAESNALSVVFASADYDPATLGRELAARGVSRIVGASSGRVISTAGFAPQGISGFHLPAGHFAAANTLIEDVETAGLPELRARVHRLSAELDGQPGISGEAAHAPDRRRVGAGGERPDLRGARPLERQRDRPLRGGRSGLSASRDRVGLTA